MEEELKGLSSSDVAARIARGHVNVDASVKTRSIKQIVASNICTLFNAINFVLACFVLVTGSYKNMLFMIVIVLNTAIGIVQEIRSKRTTDRLSIIASSKVEVIRDGVKQEISVDEVVLGDLIVLGRGDQIPSDSLVVHGTCDVNESLLTGESKLVRKEAGSTLMSGSFVNAGVVYAQVTHVGADNYAAKISAEAKEHKAVYSEIMNSLNGIIRFVSIIIFPLGAVLFAREYFTGAFVELNDAILSTVAALVGMIPEGLILLTSTVLAVAVVRLSKSKVLVQQLYCIETLARVDTLCLDKTGTITTGKMEVDRVVTLGDCGIDEADDAFYSIADADEDPNETAQAIIEYYQDVIPGPDAARARKGRPRSTSHAAKKHGIERVIPFSSDKKWSGAVFDDGSSYVMGAAQFVLGDAYGTVKDRVEELARNARVMVLARVEGFDDDGAMRGNPRPLALIAIKDQIRSTAVETVRYFIEQGVDLKVISGDDPRTVSGIANIVGIPHAESYVDATTLLSDAALENAATCYHVFGRVTPEQKKKLVGALQAAGHTVAMTGDGVNDVLALKASDCSIAMAAGSDAARNVAQLVLVNNDFASMPKVVAEGRRAINNLQRSASLFLVKTVLSMALAVCFIILPWQYPFQPIQMTLISAFTIGLPSFVLALEPNKDRIKGKFLVNVIVRSLPGSLTAILVVLGLNIVSYTALGLDYGQVSTMCVLATAWVGLLLIVRISYPFTPIRIALIAVVVGGVILGSTVFANLFGIEPFTQTMIVAFAVAAVAAVPVFNLLYSVLGSWHAKRQSELV
ncbi:HAD-IC family P-type ATPase [Raoultibacter phocaeensis]|uniref:HAD-IC family P-type ATPase n=1 Tax=Raoultibacter phocaeensis TaxID=2479841 RepID=UPI001118DC15|nr:HAD-IC family P-type ATPase [Raoultibacter phocaeensis]